MELLEKKYSKYNSSLKFKELKMSLMAFNQNQDYLNFVDEVRLETASSKPRGHFEIAYYLNGGNLKVAKEVFEKEILNVKYAQQLYLAGGHIYSNTYRYTHDDMRNYTNADKFYQLAIKHSELDFLDKMQIHSFYATYYMNNFFNKQSISRTKELEKYLISYSNDLNHIMNCKELFNEVYIDNLIDNYLFSLLCLKKEEEYIKFFESLTLHSHTRHYLTYCSLKDSPIDHKAVQLKLLRTKSSDDILAYASLLVEEYFKEKEIVFNFFSKESELILSYDFVVYSYVTGAIELKYEIYDNFIKKIEEHKYKNMEYILSYFEIALHKDTSISKEDIDKLEEMGYSETKTESRLFLILCMLQRVSQQEKYLNLAIEKQGLFRNIIAKTLKLCSEDKNLHSNKFDAFVKKIESKNEMAGYIGNVYADMNHLENAFKYYYMVFEQNKSVEIAKTLLNVSWKYYHKFRTLINNIKQTKVYNYLIGQLDELEIELLTLVFGYSFIIEKNTSNIYVVLNQYLLNSPIESMSKDLQIAFSNMHIQTMTVSSKVHNDLIFVESNKCLVKDGCTFVKEHYSIDKSYIKSYGFISVSEDEYSLKLEDKSFNEDSLFHRLTGPFTFKCDNPEMTSLKIDIDGDEPMKALFDFLKNENKKSKDFFRKYSDNEMITLFHLSSRNYKNYFSLIPFLIESDIKFNTGLINHQPIEVKKLLTLSSLIMLEHLNMLDQVLKRTDIFIQRTLVDFLIKFEEDLNSNIELLKRLSESFLYDILLNEEQNHEKKRILLVIQKIRKHERIINDHKEILPIKGVSELLEPWIGVQETQSLAYALKHQFQVITEDRMFYKICATANLNQNMLTNCMAIVCSTLLDNEKSNTLKIQLHKKSYFPVLESTYFTALENFMFDKDFDTLLESEKELFKIALSYGYLDPIFNKYIFKLQVLNSSFSDTNISVFDTNIKKVALYLQYDIGLLEPKIS